MPSRRRVLSGLGSAAATALAGCLDDPVFSPGTDADADWPMERYDAANTAFAPDAAAPRTGARERWTFEAGGASGAPVVVDGTVYQPTMSALVALDGETGEVLWEFAPTEQPWPASPAVFDGTVYVTMADDDTLHALDAESGNPNWSLSGVVGDAPPHLLAGEHVPDPMLYVGDENGVIRRLDPETGAETWRGDVFGGISAFAAHVAGLYVGTHGGEVYAYYEPGDADRSPKEGWRRKVGARVTGLLPTDNGVAVSTFGGPLTNLADGAHAGTTDWMAERKWAGTRPAHAGSWLYSPGYGGLSSLREFDKNVHWRVEGEFDTAPPVAAGDTLYVAAGPSVHAFALSGGVGVDTVRFDAKRWSVSGLASAVEGLAVADGALFVACALGEGGSTALYCLEPA